MTQLLKSQKGYALNLTSLWNTKNILTLFLKFTLSCIKSFKNTLLNHILNDNNACSTTE